MYIHTAYVNLPPTIEKTCTMSTPSIASTLKGFLALLALIVATTVFASLALFTGLTQIGMVVGLTAGASAGFIPEGTIPDPCETKYNCKPAEAVLMEYNAR